jgi:hypothetical protein
MVEITEYKEAFIVSYDNQVILIDVGKYQNTMFEATYNF